MENRTETVAARNNGGLVALAVLSAVLFVAALGLGTAYFFEMDKVRGLERQVSELKADAKEMDKEMERGAQDESAHPSHHHAGHEMPMGE